MRPGRQGPGRMNRAEYPVSTRGGAGGFACLPDLRSVVPRPPGPWRRLPENAGGAWRFPSSTDRREVQRTQDGVTDVGDNLGVRVTRLSAQLLPLGVRAERAPQFVARRHALERQHVSQVGQVTADHRLAEEDRRHAEPLENGGLAFVEHADLALRGLCVVGFVSAQLEDAGRALAGGRNGDRRHTVEGPQQGVLHADVTQLRHGVVLVESPLKLLVGGQALRAVRESRGGRVTDQRQDKRAAFGDDGAEESQRADAQALGGGQKVFAQEVRGALRLAAITQVVIAQLEEGVLLGSGNRGRGEAGRSRSPYELTALHHAILITDFAGGAGLQSCGPSCRKVHVGPPKAASYARLWRLALCAIKWRDRGPRDGPAKIFLGISEVFL